METVGLAIKRSADAVQAAIHRYRYVLLALYSLALLPVLGIIAARRVFWYDELFTVLIASLPSAGAIWDALAHGVENQPPLHFWLVHAALPASATLELSARLPSICSFWLMTLCVYRIVARETNTTYGFIAMLIPFTAPTVFFAYEARGYAPLLFFSAAAVLFWQMAKSGDHRPWSVGLLFLSLTGAAYSHYYGVLLFLPFVLTEVAVGLRTRRWDWAVLLAVFSAGAALLPLTPIMLAVGGYAEMFSNPSVISVRELYGRVLGLPSVIFGLITLGAGLVGPPPPLPPVSSGSRRVLASSDGALLLLVFCLLPVVGFFMARLVTNAYADRYFIFTVVGFSIAFAVMLHARWWDRAWFAVGCVSALALLAALEVRHHYMLPEYRAGNSVAAAAAVAATRRLRQGTEPILVSDTYYLPVYYYGPSEVKGRLLFLDEDPSEHFSVAARRLEAVRPLAIISIKELFEKYPRFYVYMPSQRLMRELRRRSMQINSVDQNLYYVFPMPL